MAKRGLGKGLDSLITQQIVSFTPADSEGGTGVTSLKLTQIKANKDQPRQHFDEEALGELAESIKQDGIIQPIVVRQIGEKYEIVAGERRFQAAKRAGIKEVPVIVRNTPDDEVFRLALIENLQRSNLNPIEEALGYKKLIDQGGLTQNQLAKSVSKSRPVVANALRLLDLPKEVQTLIYEGSITAGHARALLTVTNEEARLKLAKRIAEEHLSVREVERLAPLYSNLSEEAPKRQVQPQAFKRAARQLKNALKTRVRVRNTRGKNRIEIEFSDEEELERLVARIKEHA